MGTLNNPSLNFFYEGFKVPTETNTVLAHGFGLVKFKSKSDPSQVCVEYEGELENNQFNGEGTMKVFKKKGRIYSNYG